MYSMVIKRFGNLGSEKGTLHISTSSLEFSESVMGEEYMSCNLSQSSLVDEHLPTFFLTRLGNPSQMKSIAIFLFFFNSFLAVVFSLFQLSYPVTTNIQI